jgi:AcrR family transcriptional regulator
MASGKSKRTAARKPKPRARTYDSTRRNRQAAQTRAEVLTAAAELFNTHGWAGTTLAAVATNAGVAVETIYAGFGSKKGLLRAAMGVAVVGDAEPVPFVERDESARLGRGTREERLRAAAAVQTDVHERSAGVWRAILAAASNDPEVEQWRHELELGRRVEMRRSLGLIFERDVDERLVDACWALASAEVYAKLTGDGTWTRTDYERWLAEAITRIVGD